MKKLMLFIAIISSHLIHTGDKLDFVGAAIFGSFAFALHFEVARNQEIKKINAFQAKTQPISDEMLKNRVAKITQAASESDKKCLSNLYKNLMRQETFLNAQRSRHIREEKKYKKWSEILSAPVRIILQLFVP